MTLEDPGPQAYAAPAGVVLAQASRVNEAAAPWLVFDGRALPLLGWTQSSSAQVRSVTELVKRWDRYRSDLQSLLEQQATAEQIAQHGTPIGGLRLQAPIRPGQVFCTIGNYHRQVVEAAVNAGGPDDAHTRRMAALQTLAQRRRNGDPYVCLTSPDRVGRPVGALTLEPGVDTLDWEVEIGAVIGGSGSHLTPQRAGGIVAGYCVANDLTIRARIARPDLPALGSDWLQSKGMLGSLPLGPYFVPSWQVPDPTRLRLRLTLNEVVMQDDTAADMVFDIGQQLAYLSRHTRLRPGDLLCTGSPAGFGSHHGRFLRPGDVIRASITGLGEQVTHCIEQAEHTAADPHRPPQMEPTP